MRKINRSKNGNWLQGRSVLIILAAGGLVAVSVGLPLYLDAQAAPLHPQSKSVPSVSVAAPTLQWSAAVERARESVRVGLTEQNLPGLSVAVGVNGEIAWAEGFGWADIQTRGPVTPNTRFRIGTASTAVTSAAVGVLLDRGALSFDEEIQSRVRQFPTKRWPVTLRQLMGHVAGIGTDSDDEAPLFRQRCERPVEALQHFADRDLLFEPGTQYRYSNYGWILVSAAVEAAADQPFLTFMHEQVFGPLGMNDTGAESTKEENPEHAGEPGEDAPPVKFVADVILKPLGIISSTPTPPTAMATFYVPRSSRDPRGGRRVMRPHNLSCYAGSMAFFSTPSDLVRFGLAIHNGRLLQPATVQLLQTSQQLTSGQQTGAGLGWDLTTVTLAGQPTQAVGQNGESRGGMVSLIAFPKRGIVVAVMSNIASANTSALAQRIAEAFAD